MKTLHEDCWRSDYLVSPKDWDKKGASVKKDWYIVYYFHDPSFKDDPKLKYGKLRMIKGGINKLKTLAERRDAIPFLMKEEDNLLLEERYNPITKKYLPKPIQRVYVIDPATPLTVALDTILDKIKCSKSAHDSIRLVLKEFKAVAEKLGFGRQPVKETTRAQIRAVLDYHSDHRKKWSNNQWNHHRAYLMMAFSELTELEAIGANPVQGIRKQKVVRNIRQTLTGDERVKVDQHLAETYPAFRRYVQCFFHSGARNTELLRLQGKDVDLKFQRIAILVLKGRNYVREWRPIKDVALPFWIEAMEDCGQDDYVFSEGFISGNRMLSPKIPTRTWMHKVKKPLVITADLYSLKHLNSDETAALTDLATAAAHNAQRTKVIELYAQGEKERNLERLKKVSNTFA